LGGEGALRFVVEPFQPSLQEMVDEDCRAVGIELAKK
jgi:hypothetical protein